VSDHAEDVNKPVDQVADSSPAEEIETDAPSGDASPSDSSPETAEDKPSGAEKRIRELNWKYREAERERDRIRQEAEEAKRRLAELENRASPTTTQAGDDPPLESDYDDPAQYRQDMKAWQSRQLESWERKRQQESEAAAQAQREEERKSLLSQKLTAYASETESFAEDIERAKIQPTPALVEYLVESERAGELLHYLAKNPEHADKLSGMSPVASARELVRIEQTLEAAKTPTSSSAPEPISDLGDGDAGGDGPRPGMSTDDWVAARRAQLAARGRR